jgi:hypothetical protein
MEQDICAGGFLKKEVQALVQRSKLRAFDQVWAASVVELCKVASA